MTPEQLAGFRAGLPTGLVLASDLLLSPWLQERAEPVAFDAEHIHRVTGTTGGCPGLKNLLKQHTLSLFPGHALLKVPPIPPTASAQRGRCSRPFNVVVCCSWGMVCSQVTYLTGMMDSHPSTSCSLVCSFSLCAPHTESRN